MRISDWSSDVCSSDLRNAGDAVAGAAAVTQDRFMPSLRVGAGDPEMRGSLRPVAPGEDRDQQRRRSSRNPRISRDAFAHLFRNPPTGLWFTQRDIGSKRGQRGRVRSEEHTSELPSLMRNSYAVLSLNKQK